MGIKQVVTSFFGGTGNLPASGQITFDVTQGNWYQDRKLKKLMAEGWSVKTAVQTGGGLRQHKVRYILERQ